MNIQLLYDVIESQVFNEQFEVPELLFMENLSNEKLKETIDITADTLSKVVTADGVLLNSVILIIGQNILRTLRLNTQSTPIIVKTAGFYCFIFHLCGLIDLRMEQVGSKQKYVVYSNEGKKLRNLVSLEKARHLVLPLASPQKDYTSGHYLIRTRYKSSLDNNTIETTPVTFTSVNKSLKVGWRINRTVLKAAEWAFEERQSAFDNIWSERMRQAQDSKKRGVETIFDICEVIEDQVFYHDYYLDFRGRKYCKTPYLNEQGTDLAKGILQRAKGKRLGKDGYKWILLHLANTWAGLVGEVKTDKMPIQDRINWATDNIKWFLGMGKDPYTFIDWMKADAPFQFLAGCIDLYNYSNYYDKPNYVSHLVTYIDGSTNGSQHLAALSRDESVAPHVNLIKTEVPGDLYAYLAGFIWVELEKINKELPEETLQEYNRVIDELELFRSAVIQFERGTPEQKEAYLRAAAFYQDNKELIKAASSVYWARITHKKDQRKLVKRLL